VINVDAICEILASEELINLQEITDVLRLAGENVVVVRLTMEALVADKLVKDPLFADTVVAVYMN
jgi:hypothetical protein